MNEAPNEPDKEFIGKSSEPTFWQSFGAAVGNLLNKLNDADPSGGEAGLRAQGLAQARRDVQIDKHSSEPKE